MVIVFFLSSSFQGYAWEITTVEGGYGLQDLLSSRKSVINGTSSSYKTSSFTKINIFWGDDVMAILIRDNEWNQY